MSDEEAIVAESEVAPEVEAEAEAEEADVEVKEQGPMSLDDLEGDDLAEEESAEDNEPEAEEVEEETVEVVEFDFGGNKLEVPKDAIPEELAEKVHKFTRDTYADYQRKSQANAEQAKSLATQREAIEKITTLNGEALQTYSQGLQLRTDIEQLSQVDMNQLWQSDPDQARIVSDTLSQKQADFQRIVATVGQQEQQLDMAQQQEVERQRVEGRSQLDNYVKDFSSKVAPEVVDYVQKSYGLSPEEAKGWDMNPAVTKMAHKAMLYDRMQSKATKPVKQAQAKPVKPMKAKGNAGRNVNDPERMSMAQLNKHLGLS